MRRFSPISFAWAGLSLLLVAFSAWPLADHPLLAMQDVQKQYAAAVIRSAYSSGPGGGDQLQAQDRRMASARAPADGRVATILTSVADATIVQNLPALGIGDTSDMLAGYDSCLTPSVGILRSLVAFDVGSIPASRNVAGATLRLYLVSSCDTDGDTTEITARRIDGNWSETSVNWANAPAFSESYGTERIVHEAYGWYEFDVTDLVRNWHAGTTPNHGILLTGSEQSAFRGFSTREGIYPPELLVEYAPGNPPTNTPTVTPRAPTRTPTATAAPTETTTPSATPSPSPSATAPAEQAGAFGSFFPKIQSASRPADPTDTPTATPTGTAIAEPTFTPTPTPSASATATVPSPDHSLFASVLRLVHEGAYASISDNATLDLAAQTDEDATIEVFFFVPVNMVDDARIDQILRKQGSYALDISFNDQVDDWINFRVWTSRLDLEPAALLRYHEPLAPGWHHVAVVYDNEYAADRDRMMLYLDGRLVSDSLNGSVQIDLDPGLLNVDSPLVIGGVPNGAAAFPGYLEELRLSDSMRYTGRSYRVPVTPFAVDSATRALWRFDEPNGSTRFVDASGRDNTLSGVGGAETVAP